MRMSSSLVLGGNLLRERPRLVERGEVGEIGLRVVAELADDATELFLVAAMSEHGRAPGGEPASDLEAEAVGRAGYETV